jgi:predicted hydrocarbon binding protein
MKKTIPQKIVETEEKIFIFLSIAILHFLISFVLIMMVTRKLNINLLPIIYIILTISGFILLEKAYLERKLLKKIEEIEKIREILNEVDKK